MHRSASLTTALAAALSLLPRTSAQGWNVQNNCDATVYYAVVDEHAVLSTGSIEPCNDMGSYQAFGSIINDGYSVKLDFDGTFSSTNILQYEFVMAGGNTVWYDWSTVNGDPFYYFEKSIVANYSDEASGCTNVICEPEDESCSMFNEPFQNSPNYPCAADDGNGNPLLLTAYLCSLS